MLAIAPTTTAIFFGRRNYAANYGVVFSAYGIGAIVGGLIAGSAKDIFGSYLFAFSRACTDVMSLVDYRHEVVAWEGWGYDSLICDIWEAGSAMDWSVGSFGDIRLDRVGATILERMVQCKTVCLRQLGGDRGGELRVGRFFASEKVSAERIVEEWGRLTGRASAGRHVLAIQDTCEVKFPTTAQSRRGLGPVKKGNAYGVLVHAMIAVDALTGACLGLVDGEVWTRDGVVEVAPTVAHWRSANRCAG